MMPTQSRISVLLMLEILVFILAVFFMRTESLVLNLGIIAVASAAGIWFARNEDLRSEMARASADHRAVTIISVGLLTLLFPLFFLHNPYIIHIVVMALIYIVAILGLNVQVGSIGMVNFAHGTIFGVGAYTSALLATKAGLSFWLGLPAGILMAGLTGWILGLPTLKTREYHLSLVTIAFAYIGYTVMLNWQWTGGPDGVAGIPKPTLFGWNLGQGLTLGTVELPGVLFLYYIAWIFCALAVVILQRLHHSWVGLALNAVREDEIASRCYGLNLNAIKLTAFITGSLFAGAAGVLYAHFIGFVSTESMAFSVGLLMVCMVILGGMDNIWGVIVGGLLLTIIPEKFRALQDYRMLFYGIVLIVMLLFRPQGLFPSMIRRHGFKGGRNG
jgi:ABC-type branched-subunit amino acid transport system permease subunit